MESARCPRRDLRIVAGCHADEFVDVAPGGQGMFDPSFTVDPATGTIWMSYTNVEDVVAEQVTFRALTTRLATSTDGGQSWVDAGIELNQSGLEETLPEEFAGYSGGWVNEVSRLVFDPDPSAAEPWMLVWHRYLHVDDSSATERKAEYGWISVKTASSPLDLADAPERKLFAALGYELIGDVEYKDSWLGPPEYELHRLHAELNSCLVATEPGVLAEENAVYMSLVCIPPTGAGTGSVVLIRSTPSDGWEYVATVLTPADASGANPAFSSYSASELFAVGGVPHLMVSPNDTSDGLYNGCVVFRFDSLATGALEDGDGDSLPDPLATVLWQPSGSAETGINRGACGYTETAVGSGIVGGKAFPLSDPFARIFATHVIVTDQ